MHACAESTLHTRRIGSRREPWIAANKFFGKQKPGTIFCSGIMPVWTYMITVLLCQYSFAQQHESSGMLRSITRNAQFFSHPDYTVGFGISPNRPEGSRTIPPVGNRTLPRRTYSVEEIITLHIDRVQYQSNAETHLLLPKYSFMTVIQQKCKRIIVHWIHHL